MFFACGTFGFVVFAAAAAGAISKVTKESNEDEMRKVKKTKKDEIVNFMFQLLDVQVHPLPFA